MFLIKSNSAHAHIKGGKIYPNIKGDVYFKKTKDGVLLTAKIHNLPMSLGKCRGRFFRVSYS